MTNEKGQPMKFGTAPVEEGWTPSEAAVEVVARALYGAMYDGDFAEESPRARVKFRRYAEAALVAFMGATVPAEPCWRCQHGGHEIGDPPHASPRSLPVVECEAAGLLEQVGVVVSEPSMSGERRMFTSHVRPPQKDNEKPVFREAAPSTGSPT